MFQQIHVSFICLLRWSRVQTMNGQKAPWISSRRVLQKSTTFWPSDNREDKMYIMHGPVRHCKDFSKSLAVWLTRVYEGSCPNLRGDKVLIHIPHDSSVLGSELASISAEHSLPMRMSPAILMILVIAYDACVWIIMTANLAVGPWSR